MTRTAFCLRNILTVFVMTWMALAFSGMDKVKAQESVQVQIVNVPGILPSPFVSDLEDDVTTGRYQVHVNYMSAGTSPIELEFRVRLFKNRELLVDEISKPVSFEPGFHVLAPAFDVIQFDRSIDQVLSSLSSSLQRTVLQTGSLPEGDYRIELDARVLDDRRNVNIINGRAFFSVTHPQPPRLVTPSNRANVTMQTPLFSWTPVLTRGSFTMEYEFLMVELFEGQSPQEALVANRPHHEDRFTEITTFSYTPDFYPMESGKTYAWRVRAFEINDEMPIKNNGESEVYTFTFGDARARPEDLAEMGPVALVPGLAYITNPQDLEIEDTGNFFELNGPAEVVFQMDNIPEDITARAEVVQLMVQQTGLSNPVVAGGRVRIDPGPIAESLLKAGDMVSLSEMRYDFGTGFSVSADFQHKNFGTIQASGNVNLTHSGLQGSLVAEQRDLIRFESDVMTVSVNRIQASLPDLDIYADADVAFLGEPSPCGIRGMNLAREEIHANWSCNESKDFDLAGGNGKLDFQLNRTSGNVTLLPESRQMEFEVTARGELRFDFSNTEPCGLQLRGAFSHDAAPEFTVLATSCSISEPELDLGFASIALRNISIETFEYDPVTASWDFDIPFEASIRFPVFDDWSFEHDQPLHLTRQGIRIPEFSRERNLPEFDHEFLNLTLNEIELPEFTFPWFDWDGGAPGPWNLSFEAEASIGETTGLPFCLSSAVLSIENGEVSDGQLSADLQLAPLSDCAIEFVPDHTLHISSIGGSLLTNYEPGLSPPFSTEAELNVESRYEPGWPVTCSEDDAQQMTTADISFLGGRLEGIISLDNTQCEMPIGFMNSELNQAQLELFRDNDEQGAILSGDATMNLSSQDAVAGYFAFDIPKLKFTELDFSLQDPFTWDIPSEQPVFSFIIDQASIDLDGLHVDGRQNFKVGDHTIGTTFDNVTIDLYDWNISTGQIYLDEHFALAASFDEGFADPLFTAMPLSDEDGVERPEKGLYLELGADVIMDSTGIRTSGSADAFISVADLNYDNISVEFSDDFAFQFSPFRVAKGQIDFYFDASRIAYLDASGFNPLISGFAAEILPEKLPLPTTQIAYLRLRDAAGDLIIDFEETEPGLITLKTRPDTPLEMVIPALDPDQPPVVGGVALEDFTITATPGNFTVDTGQLRVSVPDDDVISGLVSDLGIPFDLEEIRYGRTDLLDDAGSFLQFTGDLRLFDYAVSSQANTLLKLSGNGMLSGEFDMPDLNVTIPFFDYTDHLQLGITSLSGSLAMSNITSGNISYNLDIGADLKLGSGDDSEALSSLELNFQPGSVSMTGFDSIIPDNPSGVQLPGFAMNLNAITSIPLLDYTAADGWDFLVSLDADFQFNLPGHEPFTMPVNGLQLGNSGFSIPQQNVNNSTLNGLTLPSFDIAGFTFQPLAMRTADLIEFNWFNGELPQIQPVFDFEIRLPDIADGDLEPPDGFTFTDVSFIDGFLSGVMQPYEPLGGLQIPTGPQGLNPPKLRIDEITGALGSLEVDGELIQNVDLSLAGVLEEIPFFEIEDPGCDMDVTFALDIEMGVGFSGEIQNLVPCGSVEMGPLTLSAGAGTLRFAYDEDQEAIFDGMLIAQLEGPEQTISAQGTVELDLLAGQIRDGEIAVNEPFMLGLPASSDAPFIEFEVQSAVLGNQGFLIDATGALKAGQVDIDVAFDQLLFGLPEFGIASGSAEISSGFGVQIGLSPLSASITAEGDDQPPESEALVIAVESAVTLDSDGLNFDGQAGAALRIANEDFANLRTEFEDDFALRLRSPSVKRGRALVYLDLDDEPAEEPIAIFDSQGFTFGGGLLAFVPDTLGLPHKNIAYAVIRDDEGEMLVDLESVDGGGYSIQTQTDPVAVRFPSLAAPDGSTPEIAVHFSLTTDDNYVPNGGTLSMQTSLDLEPYIGVPVSIDSLGVDSDEDLLLTTLISLGLPEAFGGQNATALTTVGTGGFEEAVITLGTVPDVYDPTMGYLIERDIMATLSGDDEESEFIVGLYGARLTINSPAQLQLAGSVSTSLLQEDDDRNFALFYSAGYDDGWSFNVSTDGVAPSVSLGFADLEFDEHEPFSFSIDEDEFIVEVSGSISFSEMLGEDLAFSFSDLQFGATGLQGSPELVFGLGSATADLPDQEFDFFAGSVTGNIINPSLSISGKTFSASVSQGDLTFFDQTVDYEDLFVDTNGNFGIGSIESEEVQILQQYLVLKSLGISRGEEEGLSLSSTFGFLIPEPIDQGGELFVKVSRDPDKAVQVESEFSSDAGYDPDSDDEITVDLGDAVTVTLTDALIGIDPMNISETEIAVAARIAFLGEDRIDFGEAGNLAENPGISVKMGRDPLVRYNITGNVEFKFKHSFFEIDIDGDVTTSEEELFQITLNGEAGIDISGVSGKAGFTGMVINTSGIDDIGNFSGEAKFDIMDVISLELGQFIHKKDDEGFSITIADGFDSGPSDLGEADEATQDIEVVEFLCFGPCPEASEDGQSGGDNSALYLSLGGESSGSSGAFSGGIHQILFYRTVNDEVTFSLDRFEVELGDMFQATASLLYQTGDGGMSLMAAGSGRFEIGESQAGAMIAGAFSTMDDDLSFGVFAAVSADVGLEVVPGVVAIAGFGGGFFYNPTGQQLDMVVGAVDDFRPDPPGDIQRASAQRPGDGDIAFAVLLYAELELIGTAGVNLLAGSVFMEITNQYFYMDADGVILGLDGSTGPGLLAGAAISAQVGRNPNDPGSITMSVNLQASLQMSPMMTGGTRGEGIQFMLTTTDDDVVWGIMGGIDMSLYGGLVGGGAGLMASNDGFLFEVDLWASLDPPIIKVEADIEGSVWYLTYDGADMPLGAYVIGNGEIRAGFTVSATVKGAFVQRASDRYELFGMGEGCAGVGPLEGCLSGWFQIKTNPVQVDGGLNPGDKSQIFEDAKAQRDEFEQMVADAMNNLQSEMDAPTVPGVHLEDQLLAQAGYNLTRTSDFYRSLWHWVMIQNEKYAGDDAPQILQDLQLFEDFGALLSWLAGAGYRSETNLENNTATSWTQASDDFETIMADIQNVADETIQRLDASVIKAIEYEADAADAMNTMMAAMATSPVTQMYRPPSAMDEGSVPYFEIDEVQAAGQSAAVEDVLDAFQGLEAQIHAVVDSIEHNLNEMDQLLGMGHVGGTTGDDTPSINAVSEMYAEALEKADRYYSLVANRYWHRINAASMVNGIFGALEGSIEDAVQTLSNRLETAYQNRDSYPSEYQNERRMAAERVRIVEDLADNAEVFATRYSFSGFPLAQQAYDDLADPDTDDFSIYEENIRGLWLDMHTLGNRQYMSSKASFISNDLRMEHLGFRQSIVDAMKINTELLDDFYDLKSSMLANLYHIMDNYIEVKGQIATEEDDILVQYQSRRQDILQMLEPPVLTKVTVDTDYPSPHFYGIADITWEAYHPSGIADVGFHITEHELDTDISVGFDEYVSIGQPDGFRYTSFKDIFTHSDILSDEPWLNTKAVNVGLRLRSIGGVSATRRATFDMQIGSGGVSTSPGQNLVPENTMPPEALYVHLEHFYNQGIVTETKSMGGRYSHITWEEEHDVFWTSDPNYIDIRVMVRETETSILKYEYAIGSSRGAGDILAWTDLVGQSGSLIGQDMYFTEAITGQSRMLTMAPGENHYISVRAYNTNNQVLEVSWDKPVVYDGTPPTAPGPPDGIMASIITTLMQSEVETRSFVSNPPDYNLSFSEQVSLRTDTDVVPSLGQISWGAATDDLSGISHYEYLVTTEEQVSDLEFDQHAFTTSETQVNITSGEGKHSSLTFGFTDLLYVHVRAVNNAGLAGEVHRVGPRYPADPNPPSVPVARGYLGPGSVRAYITERSYDAESGMLGHQFSVGTSPGASDIRSWPTGNNVDNSRTGYLYSWSTTPSVAITRDALPEGQELYINVRGVNGQGRKSRVVATGPFVLDSTPPQEPQLSLSMSGSQMEIKLQDILDPVSGISAIGVRVVHEHDSGTTQIVPWTTVGMYYPPRTGSFNKTIPYNVPSHIPAHELRIYVKVVNRAGLGTTVHEQLPPPLILLQTDPYVTQHGSGSMFIMN